MLRRGENLREPGNCIFGSQRGDGQFKTLGVGPQRGRPPEHLAPTDAKPILLRRIWQREITKLLAGEPLKEWRIPAAPLRLLPE